MKSCFPTMFAKDFTNARVFCVAIRPNNENYPLLLSISFFVSILLCSGCHQQQAKDDARKADQPLLVKLVSSGGFQGIHKELTITSDGSATLHDYRKNTESTLSLSPQEVENITQLLDQLRQTEPKRTKSCPDCVQYELTYTQKNKSRAISLNSPLPHDSPYRALVEKLLALSENNAE